MLLESWVCRLLFAFSPIDGTSVEGGKKSVVWQPWSQSYFSAAKINGYIRREWAKEWEGEARTSLWTSLSPGKFFSCLMELNRQEFSHWGKVKGKQQLQCHGWKHLSSQFTKSVLEGKPKLLHFSFVEEVLEAYGSITFKFAEANRILIPTGGRLGF